MTTANSWNSQYNSAKGSLLVGNATEPSALTVGTNGQALLANSTPAQGVAWTTLTYDTGSGSASPSAGTLTISGTGTTTTSATGSTVTITTPAGGISWAIQAATATVAANSGSLVEGVFTLTLPNNPPGGTVCGFVGLSNASGYVVKAGAANNIAIGANITSAPGGTATSTAAGDSLQLVFSTPFSGVWCSIATNGNWTLS